VDVAQRLGEPRKSLCFIFDLFRYCFHCILVFVLVVGELASGIRSTLHEPLSKKQNLCVDRRSVGFTSAWGSSAQGSLLEGSIVGLHQRWVISVEGSIDLMVHFWNLHFKQPAVGSLQEESVDLPIQNLHGLKSANGMYGEYFMHKTCRIHFVFSKI